MLEDMEFVSRSSQETQEIASKIAQEALGLPIMSHAQIITLQGDLGAGKTTFVQGFLRSLGVQEKVKSPTFLLMKQYDAADRHIFHLDCYRLASSQDLQPLEIGVVFQNPHNIVLIEWPERINDMLPKEHTSIHIDHISETERKITISHDA